MNLYQFLKSKNYNSGLNEILLDIASGSIVVYKKLNEEGGDIFGSSGNTNVQNEDVQKLDLIANDIFIKKFNPVCLIYRRNSSLNQTPVYHRKSRVS